MIDGQARQRKQPRPYVTKFCEDSANMSASLALYLAVAQDTTEVSGIIPGIGARPSTAGTYRRSTDYPENGTTGGVSCSGMGVGATAITRGGRGARPKSASASRSRSFLEVKGSFTVCHDCPVYFKASRSFGYNLHGGGLHVGSVVT